MVAAISESTGINKKQCAVLIDVLQEKIVDVVSDGGRISVKKFGSFMARDRETWRIGLNPKERKKYRFPPKRRIKFKASRVLKDGLNE